MIARILAFLERRDNILSNTIATVVISILVLFPVSLGYKIAGLAVFVLFPLVLLSIRNHSPKNYVLGLAALDTTPPATIRSKIETFRKNSILGALESDTYIATTGRDDPLSDDPEEWLAIYHRFKDLFEIIEGKPDRRRKVNLFLATTSTLSFMCGVPFSRKCDIVLYHWRRQDNDGYYTRAAIWNGGTGSPAVSSLYEKKELVTLEGELGTQGGVVSVEATGWSAQGPLEELAGRLGLPIVRIKLAAGLTKDDAANPPIMWPLAAQVAECLADLRAQHRPIHLCLSMHNVACFLMGAQLAGYGQPMFLYHWFREKDKVLYKQMLSTSELF